MSRRQDRVHSFSLIFQIPFYEPFDPAEKLMIYFNEYMSLDGVDLEFVKSIVHAVVDNKSNIDTFIEKNLKNWDIERLSLVDLALLRLAIAEILYGEIPIGVAVNEVVELAKIYSNDEAPAFINGVLGGVSKALASNEDGIDNDLGGEDE